MTISVDIETAKHQGALIVPAGSLRGMTTGKPWVMKVERGRATRQAVKVGIVSAGKAEILEGLKAGRPRRSRRPRPTSRRARGSERVPRRRACHEPLGTVRVDHGAPLPQGRADADDLHHYSRGDRRRRHRLHVGHARKPAGQFPQARADIAAPHPAHSARRGGATASPIRLRPDWSCRSFSAPSNAFARSTSGRRSGPS